MLLRAVLRRVWREMPPAVLASSLTSTEGRDLPSRRCSTQVFPQVLPRSTAVYPATNYIKTPRMWEADIKREEAAEIGAVLTRHAPELEATAEMFEVLPRIAAEEGVAIPRVGDDKFFRLAYRAAVRQLSGAELDGEALRALLGEQWGRRRDFDGPTGDLYAGVMAALAHPPFRATIEGVLDDGRRAREAWQVSGFVPEVWDDVIGVLCRLLETPEEPCLVVREGLPRWDAVLDAGAQRWGLRTTAGPVVLGERVPNKLPRPLDRTVAERLGSVLGRGTDADKLSEMGRGVEELLLESAARASEPLGLSEPSSRSVVALGMLAADLLQADEPEQVTDRYGHAAREFGTNVSKAFGSVHKLLEYYDPRKARDSEGEGDVGAREGYIGEESEAEANQQLVNLGRADELRDLLSTTASDALTIAVWKIVHRHEVLGLEPVTVATARQLVRGRARHVSKAISDGFRESVSDQQKRERLPGDIMAILGRLSPEDARAIATRGSALPADVKTRLREANEANRREDPEAEWVSAAAVRRFLPRLGGNG